MAKLTGPLLSFGARGQLGKTVVTSSWKGIDYMRQYVIPANPKTTAQTTNRTMFAFLREVWKLAPTILRAPWDAFATGRPFTGMNKLVGENLRLLQGKTDLLSFIASPGARGGIPFDAITVAAGGAAGEIDVTFDLADQLPDGWSQTFVSAMLCENLDPDGIFVPPLLAATAASPATSLTFSDLDNTKDYIASGWVEYTKADGLKAYSVALTGNATPT